jgi:aconitate hydratase 2/2-methylisocitrate dehydratase
MVGGYNVHPLIELLDDAEVAGVAAEALKKTLLMFDYFNDVAAKAKAGNAKAKEVMQSWADAEWFTSRPKVEEDHRHRVQGAGRDQHRRPVARARRLEPPRHPLHYLAMLKNTRPDAAFKPEKDGKRGPMQFIEDLKKKGTSWPTWATWWAPAPAASRPPTRSSGPPARTFPSCPTSALAA